EDAVRELTGNSEFVRVPLLRQTDDEFTPSDVFKAVGQTGYWQGHADFNSEANSGTFVVQISQRGLFRTANMSRKSQNLAGLHAAMTRLTEPVGLFPPVLRRFGYLRSGKLRLEVTGFWLPPQR